MEPNYPKTRLRLWFFEKRIALKALENVQSIAGIGVAGPRAAAMHARFASGDFNVTLPEFTTLGFALSRLDTPKGYALLKKLTKFMTKGTEPPPIAPVVPTPRGECDFCNGIRKVLHLPPYTSV